MKKSKWFQTKLLFLERNGEKFSAVRFYLLLSAASYKKAVLKGNDLGAGMDYPYTKKKNTSWKYIGVEEVFECFEPPSDGAFISVFKDSGSKWEDAVCYIKSLSQYEISIMSKPKSGVYVVNIVYFIRDIRNKDKGKITTCEVLIKVLKKENIVEKAYKLAVDKKSVKKAARIRRDCNRDALSEFVGIEDIRPVYDSFQDGMEIWRSVEKLKNEKDILGISVLC